LRPPQSQADGSSPLLAYLQRQQPRWIAAVDALAAQYAERREQVERQVDHYANIYSGQRAAMVYDVVASRRRRHLERVQPLVQVFSTRPAAASLSALAEHGPGPGLSLMAAGQRGFFDQVMVSFDFTGGTFQLNRRGNA